jgi:hypothetical protein
LGAVFIILYSCTKDFEFDKLSTENLSGEWAFPLIHASVTLEDILNDTSGIITTGEDGFVTLIYESDNLVSMDGSERTVIPDQVKNLTKSFLVSDTLPNGDPIPSGIILPPFTIPFYIQFDMVDENHRIDRMDLTQGEYIIGFTTNLNRDNAQITLMVSNFVHKVTNDTLQATFDLDNPGGQELTMSRSIDLSEYYVQFDNSVQQNKIIINALVSLVTDDNPNLSPYFIELHNQFNHIEFKEFYGFIGENVEVYSDTIDISIFNATDFSALEFGEGSVKLRLDVYNSLGIPITLDISNLTAYNTVDGIDSLDLNIDPSIININYPTLDHFNEYVLTEINTDDINVNEIIDISPNKLLLNVKGFLNQGAPAESVNYFANNSNLYVDAALELELFGGISSLQIVDTLAFDPTSFEGFDAVEFMVEITNGFPISADIQLDFVDQDFNVVYTLIPENERLIEAGDVGSAPEYRVTSSTSKKTFIAIDRNGLDLIEQCRNVFFKAVLGTENSQLVKIYSDYDIQLMMGAKVIYIY